MNKNTRKKLAKIARENIPRLEGREDLEAALAAAYELGRADACGDCGYKIHSNAIAKLHNCNDCGAVIDCEHMPKVGNWARINCPLWKPKRPRGSE